MPTYSTRQHLILPAGSEPADIATIIANWNKLDGTSGLVLCTEATKPTTNKFPGMYIRTTDSARHYYLDATGSWINEVYVGGAWIDVTVQGPVGPTGPAGADGATGAPGAPGGLPLPVFGFKGSGTGTDTYTNTGINNMFNTDATDPYCFATIASAGLWRIEYSIPYQITGLGALVTHKILATGGITPVAVSASSAHSDTNTATAPVWNSFTRDVANTNTALQFNAGLGFAANAVDASFRIASGVVYQSFTGTVGAVVLSYRTAVATAVLNVTPGAFISAQKVS